MTAQEIAEPTTILRGLVGSTVHGVNIEGSDDTDEMGVCVEGPEHVIGLDQFEQWVYRTQPEGTRSGPGDLDLTIYSLRKWARLAANGNPTVLLLLFVPDGQCSVLTYAGQLLRRNAHLFASRRAGKSFLGYLEAQRQRLMGERGGMRQHRTDLIGRHGYDTKYAMHMVRLGLQGVEFMETGQLSLPMVRAERAVVREIRSGEWSLENVLTFTGHMERRLKDLLDVSPLPPEPDRGAIDRLLVELYMASWTK